MARRKIISTTKYEIIQVAAEYFLNKGVSVTSPKMIAEELDISTGNITYYFHSKEHLLAVFVEMLGDFQQEMMDREADEGISSVLAICLELATMAAMCEENEIAKDFYLSAYSSDMCLEIIQRNDIKRAKRVFAEYCKGWTDEQFTVTEALVAGIEQATFRTNSLSPTLETRISGALEAILSLYKVPKELRRVKLEKVLRLDYRGISRRIFKEFKEFVNNSNEHAFDDLLQMIRNRAN